MSARHLKQENDETLHDPAVPLSGVAIFKDARSLSRMNDADARPANGIFWAFDFNKQGATIPEFLDWWGHVARRDVFSIPIQFNTRRATEQSATCVEPTANQANGPKSSDTKNPDKNSCNKSQLRKKLPC